MYLVLQATEVGNVTTVLSLKYLTAKNNSKWECPENFRDLLIIEPKCPVWTREFYGVGFEVFFLFFGESTFPIISAFCVRRSGPTKTHTERWSVVITATVRSLSIVSIVKTTYWRHFNADKQNHNTNHRGTAAFGLPKYRSCALPSTKDSTHDTMQVTNHFRKAYCLLK